MTGNGALIGGAARALRGLGAPPRVVAAAGAMRVNEAKSAEFRQHVADLEEAFPEVDPGLVPMGGRVLVQLKTAKKSKKITRDDGTEAELHYVEYSQEVERDVQQVGRLIAIGALAFRDKKTLEPWPECVVDGKFVPWASPGDYIKVPKYGGDRHYMPIPGRAKDDRAAFIVINEHEIISKITCNPLHIIAYLE